MQVVSLVNIPCITNIANILVRIISHQNTRPFPCQFTGNHKEPWIMYFIPLFYLYKISVTVNSQISTNQYWPALPYHPSSTQHKHPLMVATSFCGHLQSYTAKWRISLLGRWGTRWGCTGATFWLLNKSLFPYSQSCFLLYIGLQ